MPPHALIRVRHGLRSPMLPVDQGKLTLDVVGRIATPLGQEATMLASLAGHTDRAALAALE